MGKARDDDFVKTTFPLSQCRNDNNLYNSLSIIDISDTKSKGITAIICS